MNYLQRVNIKNDLSMLHVRPLTRVMSFMRDPRKKKEKKPLPLIYREKNRRFFGYSHKVIIFRTQT